MTSSTKQISAHLSPGTHALLERFAAARGLKKGYLVEQALLHHLLALEALPPTAVVPPRIVVTDASAHRILDLLRNPPPCTDALRDLLRGAEEATTG
jgi:uncharacterized protein (DUF1778 family)